MVVSYPAHVGRRERLAIDISQDEAGERPRAAAPRGPGECLRRIGWVRGTNCHRPDHELGSRLGANRHLRSDPFLGSVRRRREEWVDERLSNQYLDVASSGLVDFIRLRSVTASSLAQMVTSQPKYFASIRGNNLGLATNSAVVSRIRANYATIKNLYPPAVFPPVTLLVGRFSTGGTTSTNGMLIGSEFYSIDATTPLDELVPFQHDNVKSVDSLPIIVAHEHAHILQLNAAGVFTHPNKNLLEQSLMEGGADFIGERSSGGNINGRLWAFAIPNEAALWQEFTSAMHGTDVSRWLYNQGSATATPTRPGDLGYFIGYRIVEAYYLKQMDKGAALRDIIEMKDADDFLARSGYSP